MVMASSSWEIKTTGYSLEITEAIFRSTKIIIVIVTPIQKKIAIGWVSS